MSSRAQFLKKALRCWEDKDGTGLHDLAIDLDADDYYGQLEAFTEEDNRILNELCTELTRDTGERLATERTSLSPAAPPGSAEIMIKHCGRLSPRAKQFITTGIAALENAHSQISPLSEETGKKDETDALDCHYACEALEKLDTLVARALRLERLPVRTAPNAAVQRYFQEAHDCYLYGFDIACAVLCRAILEAALEDLIAPKDREGKSVVGMVHVAKHRGLFRDERAAWAEEICTAGNLAIHEYQKFEKRYEPKRLEDLFWKARAVVEDLYTK